MKYHILTGVIYHTKASLCLMYFLLLSTPVENKLQQETQNIFQFWRKIKLVNQYHYCLLKINSHMAKFVMNLQLQLNKTSLYILSPSTKPRYPVISRLIGLPPTLFLYVLYNSLTRRQRKASFLIQSTPPRTPVARHRLALVAAAWKPSVAKL